MPYKRPGSSYYQVQLYRLPGVGKTPVLSTQVTSKTVARRMEDALRELAERTLIEPAWRPLLDAVMERRVTLPDLMAARSARRMDALLRSLSDPLVTDAVAAYREARPRDERYTRLGLDMLLHYAPASARLSHLDARTIMRLCHEAEADPEAPRKRNTVRRSLLRAVSKLLRHHLGRTERDRVFADVHFPAEDDTREVTLTPAEIGRLMDAATELGYPEIRTAVRFALQTSADRGAIFAGGPMPGLRAGDVRIYAEQGPDGLAYTGEAYLRDTKTTSRPRTVPLTDSLCRELLVLVEGKAPAAPVFETTYSQVDIRWRRTRERAGLGHVRFKDLRSVFAAAAEEAGVPLTVVVAGMGHSDEAMTRRYQRRQAAMSAEQAAAVERALGLTG